MKQLFSLVPPKRIRGLIDSLQTALKVEGEVWECGVYQGGTASHIVNVVPLDRCIRLFDSFEGLGEPTRGKDNFHKRGDFSPANDPLSVQQKLPRWSFEGVSDYFVAFPNVTLHKGWIPTTFMGLEDSQIAFCHIDLDLYQGYLDVLEFVWPRLAVGGVVVLDDYAAAACLGAKMATDEFCAKHGQSVENYQCPHAQCWRLTKQRND